MKKYDLERSGFISAAASFGAVFLPLIVMCIAGLCIEFIWSVFIAAFVLLSIYAVLLVFFWIKAHKITFYLQLHDEIMEIVYCDALSMQTKKMRLHYDQIKQIEYYRLHSLLSWLQLVSNYVYPMCVYVTYVSDADGEEYSARIGYLRLREVKEIAARTGIDLKLK